MKTKNLSLVSIGFVLLIAVGVSYLVARPLSLVRTKTTPVFMGTEIKANKAVKADRAVKVNRAVRAEKAVKIVPAPQPKVAPLLPITPPQVLNGGVPVYPEKALEKEEEGKTLLSVLIDAMGKPKEVKVKTSSGFSELDKAAIRAVSNWQFIPAMQGGKSVASWYEVPVRFEVE